MHYLISDREGNSAIIEYVNHSTVIIESKRPYQVSTNFIINEVQPVGANTQSVRYNTLVEVLSKIKGKIDTEFAMDILEDVSQSEGETDTRWSVVYDMRKMFVTVAINRDYRHLYEFAFE